MESALRIKTNFYVCCAYSTANIKIGFDKLINQKKIAVGLAHRYFFWLIGNIGVPLMFMNFVLAANNPVTDRQRKHCDCEPCKVTISFAIKDNDFTRNRS